MSENIYIQPGTQYYPGLFDTEVILTIAKADQRYIKKGSDANYNVINATARIEVESTNNTSITSSSNCDEYGLHLHAVLASSTGIRSGCAISFNNSSSDNVPLGAICLDKIGSGSGELVMSVRNGATCNERMRLKNDGLKVTGYINPDQIIMSNGVTDSDWMIQADADIRYVRKNNTAGDSMLGSLTITRTTNGDSLILNNGTGSFRINTNTNNASVIGMQSNHALSFQTNNLVRGSITAAGLFDWVGNTRAACYTSVSTANDTAVFTNTNGTADFRISSFSTAAVIGMWSNHTLSFSTNNAIRGSIAPAGTLIWNHKISIAGSNSETVSGQRGLLQASTQTFRSDTINNVPISMSAVGWIASDLGFISYSDKRLKNDIREVSISEAMRLLNVKPISYVNRNDPTNERRLGVIAQDLIKNELDMLTGIVKNESVDEMIEDDVLSPAGFSWVVNYDKMCVYLLKIIQKQQSDLSDQQYQLNNMNKDIELLIQLLPKTKRAQWEQQNQQADELK